IVEVVTDANRPARDQHKHTDQWPRDRTEPCVPARQLDPSEALVRTVVRFPIDRGRIVVRVRGASESLKVRWGGLRLRHGRARSIAPVEWSWQASPECGTHRVEKPRLTTAIRRPCAEGHTPRHMRGFLHNRPR